MPVPTVFADKDRFCRMLLLSAVFAVFAGKRCFLLYYKAVMS